MKTTQPLFVTAEPLQRRRQTHRQQPEPGKATPPVRRPSVKVLARDQYPEGWPPNRGVLGRGIERKLQNLGCISQIFGFSHVEPTRDAQRVIHANQPGELQTIRNEVP